MPSRGSGPQHRRFLKAICTCRHELQSGHSSITKNSKSVSRFWPIHSALHPQDWPGIYRAGNQRRRGSSSAMAVEILIGRSHSSQNQMAMDRSGEPTLDGARPVCRAGRHCYRRKHSGLFSEASIRSDRSHRDDGRIGADFHASSNVAAWNEMGALGRFDCASHHRREDDA